MRQLGERERSGAEPIGVQILGSANGQTAACHVRVQKGCLVSYCHNEFEKANYRKYIHNVDLCESITVPDAKKIKANAKAMAAASQVKIKK